jgi:hypothetical protein
VPRRRAVNGVGVDDCGENSAFVKIAREVTPPSAASDQDHAGAWSHHLPSFTNCWFPAGRRLARLVAEGESEAMMLLRVEGWQPPRAKARAANAQAIVVGCFIAVLGSTSSALAGTRCVDLMLSCTFGDVARPVSMPQLAGNEALRRKVQKNMKSCDLLPTTDEPFGCDWKATIRGGALQPRRSQPDPAPPTYGAGQPERTPPSAAPGDAPGAPAANDPTPAPRRDAAGRYGTTPAPQQPRAAASIPDRGPYAEQIEAAATRYQLPADLLRAVMQVESGYNPEAQSVKGAVGLMQLLPETGRAMGADDLRDPAQNILGGARFLRLLANRFGGDLVKVLSAYHAGGTRVLRREATPFAATDSYVRKVLGVYYALRDG